ncbi:C2H2-type zinc finger domain containing protein [Phanerochaete sordida]|uniref:C2H2-type zinc finger domain containing protein n=1 Tax=Phanerochaete sordida TaxID=48140 RepID=A0A9P3G1K3_9APHY|nr:C2H2-type zinc finger domain containing protein [Phanerochaete sordida]
MDRRDFPALVPLSTLQHTLIRNLYPQLRFDIPDDDDHIFDSLMTSPTPVPPPQEARESTPQAAATPTNAQEAETPTESRPAARSSSVDEGHRCQWVDCDKVSPDPETLYNHLCNDHIGRKSTGNLCLTCKWKDCNTTCAKRDHITSHLRVHTPLKPHVCEVCSKPFKRPQDLKKHEKIHTEEHHAQHKHSKAITVADPVYSSRVRGDSISTKIDVMTAKAKLVQSPVNPTHKLQLPSVRAKSSSLSLSESSSDFGVLPTPSPELQHSSIQYHAPEAHDPYRIQPSWEVLRPDGSSGPVSGVGSKRSYDYDEFFTDVKKRRVNPSYDPHMAERLSSLAHSHGHSLSQTTVPHAQHPHQHPHGQGFNPRSVSFDIRSPEELAAVNEFLITLGRDVTGPSNVPRNMPHQDFPSAPQSYFDPETLAQMGLAGMPGIPTGPGSGSGYHGDTGYGSSHGLVNPLPQTAYPSRPSHPSLQTVQYGNGLYPQVADLDFTPASATPGFHPQQVQRRISLSPLHDDYPARSTFHQPTPTHFLSPGGYDPSAGGASPMSSHSTMSTPPNATPPQLSDLPSFDYVRQPRGPPPAVQLAPVDYTQRTMRTIVPLRNAGGRDSADQAAPPEPVQPKWEGPAHVRGPLKLTSEYPAPQVSASSSGSSSRSASPTALRKPDSLYSHLLREGDEKYKLPPIAKKFLSPSPAPSDSPMSRASTLSPPPRRAREGSLERDDTDAETERSSPSPPPTLPPIRQLAPAAARTRSLTHYTEELARGVGGIALDGRAQAVSDAQRRQHAELLRDMLVAINGEYRRRFGTPPPAKGVPGATRKLDEEAGRDVEMAVA